MHPIEHPPARRPDRKFYHPHHCAWQGRLSVRRWSRSEASGQKAVVEAIHAARRYQTAVEHDEAGQVLALTAQAIGHPRALARTTLEPVAGVQEVSWLMLKELEGQSAEGDLAGLVKSIHLDALRENARGHALAIAAA
jgi:hypothetical protein